MTDIEKKALAEAFGFGKPDRKEEFTEEFRRLNGTRNKRNVFPVAAKFAAAAAMIAAGIGTAVIFPRNRADFGTQSDNSIITDVPVTAEGGSAVKQTSSAVTTNKPVTASATSKTTVASSAASAVTTAAGTETNERSASTALTTGTAAAPAAPPTTASKAEEKAEQHDETPAGSANAADNCTSEGTGRDLTVALETVYPLRDKIISAEDLQKASDSKSAGSPDNKDGMEYSAPGIMDDNEPIGGMYKNSSVIVLAKLDEIVYTSIDGSACTAENITVEKVYKGDLDTGDRLTVFFTGGYIPCEDYIAAFGGHADQPRDYSVAVKGEYTGKQIQGGQYLFFLTEGDLPYPGNSFRPVRDGAVSVFEKHGGIYISTGRPDLILTEEQAEKGL